jgi:hypothetical protein
MAYLKAVFRIAAFWFPCGSCWWLRFPIGFSAPPKRYIPSFYTPCFDLYSCSQLVGKQSFCVSDKKTRGRVGLDAAGFHGAESSLPGCTR